MTNQNSKLKTQNHALERSEGSKLGAAAVALVLLLVLSGCWPFPPSGTTPSPTPSAGVQSPSATLSPQAEGTAPPGGPGADLTPLPGSSDALNIAGSDKDPPTLDPALANDTYSHLIIRQLFSGLVTYDDNLKIVPDVAAALPSVSKDGKTYTFVLRKGVRFTDGREVNAGDFKYSMERATDPKLAGAQSATDLPAALYLGDIVGVKEKLEGKATEITGVQAPDPYTLVITIDAPKAYFLSKLTAGPAFVVEDSNVKEGPNWTEKPRGSGPFKLEKWVHNQQIVLARNDGYFGASEGAGGGARTSPALINIWMGANATGVLQQYEVGGLDVADVPVDDLERVTDRNNPMSKELQTVPEMEITYLAFNLHQKPFDDPKIRESFSLAIDRQKIARVMFQSRVRQAQTFVPPDMPGYTPPTVEETYNVTRARALLAESTYKDARNLPRLRLYTPGDELGPMLKDVFSQTLGVDLEVHEVEWSDFLDGLDRGDYPMFTFSWIADYPDPENFLGALFLSSSPENSLGYHNADVDQALQSAAVEPDPARRMAAYTQIEERILKDHPAVPLYHSVQYTLVKPYVKDLKVTPMGLLNLKDTRLVGKGSASGARAAGVQGSPCRGCPLIMGSGGVPQLSSYSSFLAACHQIMTPAGP